jgi:hypothetical protein
MFKLESLKKVEKTFTKKGGVVTREAVDYKIKVRRFIPKGKDEVASQFVVNEKLWNQLGLDAKGFIQTNSEENGKILAVGLALVAEDKASIFPTMREGAKEKGRQTRNEILADALIAAGVITDEVGKTQYLDLKLVSGSEAAVQALYKTEGAIYEVISHSPSNVSASTESEEVEEESNDEVATPAPTEAASEEDAW